MEPMLRYHEFDPQKHISMKSYTKFKHFHSINAFKNILCKMSTICKVLVLSKWKHIFLNAHSLMLNNLMKCLWHRPMVNTRYDSGCIKRTCFANKLINRKIRSILFLKILMEISISKYVAIAVKSKFLRRVVNKIFLWFDEDNFP